MRDRTRLSLGNRGEHRRHQWPKHGDVVAHNVNDDHRELNSREVLLIFEIAVNREKNVKLPPPIEAILRFSRRPSRPRQRS
jgi:hypothetical protein